VGIVGDMQQPGRSSQMNMMPINEEEDNAGGTTLIQIENQNHKSRIESAQQ